MFYYMMSPIMTYNWLLIAAAVMPAIFLMVKVYRSDRIEKERKSLLWKLAIMGVLSTLIAKVEERVGQWILRSYIPEDSPTYNMILYFAIVAVAEESSKYLLLKKGTWRDPEFNCQYDGVVYATFVSLGFALWENIQYVLSYGLSTALVRAVTAIPGHACFGVFMGVFYGLAKRADYAGHPLGSKILRLFALAFPMLLHGAYDYIATLEELSNGWYFLGFVAVMFFVSFVTVNIASKNDRYID